MKKLCLLTNEFPYGTGEAYLETEVKFYKGFEKTWVCALQLRDEHLNMKRELPGKMEVIPVRYAKRIVYLLNVLKILPDRNIYSEILRLIKQGRFSFSRLVDLFVFVSRAHYEASIIDRALKDQDKRDVVFYSYRFEYQPYVAMLLKKKWKTDAPIFARAHRYDLYEDQHNNNYIPFREIILKELNEVMPCSDHGTKYLQELFPVYAHKVRTEFLGTIDCGLGIEPDRNGEFHIVSCSNAVPVKRLELIVEALRQIQDVSIRWTHFGDGPVLQQVRDMAKSTLPESIRVEFPGNLANSELMREYAKTPIDLFINVSSSEGIPVSIMEANSFGIPCIATNVGGTCELIRDGVNGRLLDADLSASELAEEIKIYCQMSDVAYRRYRLDARHVWNEKFNAEKNYKRFIEVLYNKK